MNRIWGYLASLLYQYGKYGAGEPNIHTSYEPTVSQVLQQEESEYSCDST
ncbi:MAG: hypothetical protein RSE23_03660 [Clostridia bacterium]